MNDYSHLLQRVQFFEFECSPAGSEPYNCYSTLISREIMRDAFAVMKDAAAKRSDVGEVQRPKKRVVESRSTMANKVAKTTHSVSAVTPAIRWSAASLTDRTDYKQSAKTCYNVSTPDLGPFLDPIFKSTRNKPSFFAEEWIAELILNLTDITKASKDHSVHNKYIWWLAKRPAAVSRNRAEDLLLFVGDAINELFQTISSTLSTPRNEIENEYRSNGWVQDEEHYVMLAVPELFTINQENKIKDIAKKHGGGTAARKVSTQAFINEVTAELKRPAEVISRYLADYSWYLALDYAHKHSTFQRFTNEGTAFSASEIAQIMEGAVLRTCLRKEYLQLWRELGRSLQRAPDSVAACWREQRLLKIHDKDC